MPNWCFVDFTIFHHDCEMVDRFERASHAGQLLDEFIPMPVEYKNHGVFVPGSPAGFFPMWRQWRCQYWGTKWDIGCADGQDGSIYRINDNKLRGSFASAYAPPYDGFMTLGEMGFRFTMRFETEGFNFSGYADNDRCEVDDVDEEIAHECCDDGYVSATDMARYYEMPREHLMDQMFCEDDLDVVSRGAFV